MYNCRTPWTTDFTYQHASDLYPLNNMTVITKVVFGYARLFYIKFCSLKKIAFFLALGLDCCK